MPDQVGLELIANELGVVVPGSVRETAFFRGQASVWVEPAHVRAVLGALRERHGYRMLMSVHGVDYYPEEPRLGVHYELLDMARVDRIAVKLRVPVDQPQVESVTQTGRRRTIRNARSTTCSASSSTATPICVGF